MRPLVAMLKVGVIGGSGLYDPEVFGGKKERKISTEYGEPSDSIWLSRVGRVDVAFIARHGRNHTTPPHRLNHRANIAALADEGVSAIITSSSVGSLRLSIKPGALVVPDDFLSPWLVPTFFDSKVEHATPDISEELRQRLLTAARAEGYGVRNGGVYVQTIGPRLETRAEIRFLSRLGDVLGMTVASEATLASELRIPYAALCSVDNYCNGIAKRPLTYAQIQAQQQRNSLKVRRVMIRVLEDFD